jgi:hypothetical protein
MLWLVALAVDIVSSTDAVIGADVVLCTSNTETLSVNKLLCRDNVFWPRLMQYNELDAVTE